MNHRERGEKKSCNLDKRQDLENNLIISVVEKTTIYYLPYCCALSFFVLPEKVFNELIVKKIAILLFIDSLNIKMLLL